MCLKGSKMKNMKNEILPDLFSWYLAGQLWSLSWAIPLCSSCSSPIFGIRPPRKDDFPSHSLELDWLWLSMVIMEPWIEINFLTKLSKREDEDSGLVSRELQRKCRDFLCLFFSVINVSRPQPPFLFTNS